MLQNLTFGVELHNKNDKCNNRQCNLWGTNLQTEYLGQGYLDIQNGNFYKRAIIAL